MSLHHSYQKSLRHIFADQTSWNSDIQRILMVGAEFWRRAVLKGSKKHYIKTLSDPDETCLTNTFNFLEQHSLYIYPDFEIEVINMLKPHGGKDFLRGNYKGDLVIFCNVWPDQNDKSYGKWYQPAVDTNASYLVCAHNGGLEIRASDFTRGETIFEFKGRKSYDNKMYELLSRQTVSRNYNTPVFKQQLPSSQHRPSPLGIH